ncbi:hypothetical protein ACFL0H_14725 [Thermodesulfobacteriota bacterium]
MKLILIISFCLIIILFTGRGPSFSKSNIDQNTANRLEHISSEDSSSSANIDESLDGLEDRLKELKKQFELFSKRLKEKIPERKELKSLINELNRLREEVRKSGKSVKDKIEKEFIPKLKKEIDKLRDKLLKPHEKGPGEPIQI